MILPEIVRTRAAGWDWEPGEHVKHKLYPGSIGIVEGYRYFPGDREATLVIKWFRVGPEWKWTRSTLQGSTRHHSKRRIHSLERPSEAERDLLLLSLEYSDA